MHINGNYNNILIFLIQKDCFTPESQQTYKIYT